MAAGATAYRYGMKEPGRRGGAPGPAKPGRPGLLIALSLLETAIVGPFALIPLMWSVMYRHAAKADPATPLRRTAKAAVAATAAVGTAAAAGVALLYLLSRS